MLIIQSDSLRFMFISMINSLWIMVLVLLSSVALQEQKLKHKNVEIHLQNVNLLNIFNFKCYFILWGIQLILNLKQSLF